MNLKTLEFLEAHQSETPSTFTEDAEWRQANGVWPKRPDETAKQQPEV